MAHEGVWSVSGLLDAATTEKDDCKEQGQSHRQSRAQPPDESTAVVSVGRTVTVGCGRPVGSGRPVPCNTEYSANPFFFFVCRFSSYVRTMGKGSTNPRLHNFVLKWRSGRARVKPFMPEINP